MDFYRIVTATDKNGNIEVYPEFIICKSKDIMLRTSSKGSPFYAIWNPKTGLWSTDEYDVREIIDDDIWKMKNDLEKKQSGDIKIIPKLMSNDSSKVWKKYRQYLSNMPDNIHQLDTKITFASEKVKKSDYVSKRLSYDLSDSDCPSYNEIMSVLYSPEERTKLEWSIGSIVAGDSKTIQKFVVLYGEMGTGKSTVINIIQKLFDGYYTTFDAKRLASSNDSFATEVFKSNPLVAIQHDGDLSRIEDNTTLNSIVAHEEMTMNEKFKSMHTARVNAFLFMGSNKPVRITDSKSGIIRRLIDVSPTGNKIPPKRFEVLYSQIDFELGAIANHCLSVYRKHGKNYYKDYKPMRMIIETDFFYNYVEENYFKFKEQDGTTLKAAYDSYKQFCQENGTTHWTRNKFAAELRGYFDKFSDITRVDGKQVRSWYSGFLVDKFRQLELPADEEIDIPNSLVLDQTKSLLDDYLADYPAQYEIEDENGVKRPQYKWANCKTKLKDLDTSKTHYVKPMGQLIFVDFDLKDENGNKSAERNLAEASKWPATYGEYSNSGAGIHLYYIYDGDIQDLDSNYAENIEIKVFPEDGGAAMRRRVTKCNDIPIAHISAGLPLKKKGEKVVSISEINNEKHLRNLIEKNLRKEVHPYTAPSVNMIKKILDDAYESGLAYDVTDMKSKIVSFARNSSHQSEACLKQVSLMHFASEKETTDIPDSNKDQLVFFDCEVFPNLLLVNWKYLGPEHKCVRMINPTSADIERLMTMKLIGFNCRKYDNHIIYARYLGWSNEEIYNLSQTLVGKGKKSPKDAFFKDAYNISYTDVYDYAKTKQSLKKWEIALGIHHLELGLPWDEPVPEDQWVKVAEYCDNDVIATEAVFNATQKDFMARQILVDICNAIGQKATLNDTTNTLTTKIILRGNKDANKSFVYPDLAQEFPGYEFKASKFDPSMYNPGAKIVSRMSLYKGEDPGEGGRVYARPGAYRNVVTFDVASMHPSSIIAENGFGPYTENFKQLLDIRLAIKHKQYETLYDLYGGILKKYLTSEKDAKALSSALKLAINSVYGLTAASFAHPLRDPRNKDNWVAKRGALFMIDLQEAVEKMGATVVHIKTDSIKVENPTDEVRKFIIDFGKSKGYTFEIEAVYERICLVNESTYIAKLETPDEEHPTGWTATGDQFKVPYVFKTLFSKEDIQFDDLCETNSVKDGAIYLDMNESIEDPEFEAEVEKRKKKLEKSLMNPELSESDAEEIRKDIQVCVTQINAHHNYKFIGKVGQFCPVKPGFGGGLLKRFKDDKYYYVSGSTGYRWLESQVIRVLDKKEMIDISYYDRLAEEAKAAINEFCDYEQFAS